MLEAIKEKTANAALNKLNDVFLSKEFAQFGQIKQLSYKDKKLNMAMLLKGLEDKEIEVSCASVRIADDGSSITLSDYSSNVECVATALNLFAAREIPLPDNGMVRSAVIAAKKILGL